MGVRIGSDDDVIVDVVDVIHIYIHSRYINASVIIGIYKRIRYTNIILNVYMCRVVRLAAYISNIALAFGCVNFIRAAKNRHKQKTTYFQLHNTCIITSVCSYITYYYTLAVVYTYIILIPVPFQK